MTMLQYVFHLAGPQRGRAAAVFSRQLGVRCGFAGPPKTEGPHQVTRRIFCSSNEQVPQPPPIVEIEYETLKHMTPEALKLLQAAFVGPKAYGVVAVTNIPGYGKRRRDAFRAGINLALADPAGRERAAAVSNTYPGWSGTPGEETHPLQSSFLFNVKEEIDGGRPDPYFGKNIFPSEEYRRTFVELASPMHDAALEVLRGCDLVIEDLTKKNGHQEWSTAGRSLHRLAAEGPALAGRFICYDSGFTREDKLLSERGSSAPVPIPDQADALQAKSAGHASDGLASMRTHSTPVKSAGHAGDGLASMRTHSTPVKSAGHAGDGLAAMRTAPPTSKPVGQGRNTDVPASARAHSTQIAPRDLGGNNLDLAFLASQLGNHVVEEGPDGASGESGSSMEAQRGIVDDGKEVQQEDVGDYWLPWHIDSNFVTVLHKEMYAYESDTSFAPEPDGAGLLMMNEAGDVAKLETQDDALIVQMGAFAQIYAGGYVAACRHAVRSPRPPGIARFNFCNFWYVPWSTVCDTVEGRHSEAVSKGWNAMMDESYLDITMKQSFAAFRQFMTSPEARLQFADSVRFKELAELLPLPASATGAAQSSKIVVDVLTDVRCPFSYISQTGLELALAKMSLGERAVIRYHPVFLNPNVPKEGESLDDYLLREYGYSKEYAHSEDYPLRLAGLEVGVHLNPNRRVVNTFDAHCLVELAQEQGKQHEVVKALSRRYFEHAEDISDADVLRAVMNEVGLESDAMSALGASRSVSARYSEMSARVGEVPLFLIRESISGNGVEVGGNRSVADWEGVLAAVLEKSRFVGMAVPGPDGKDVWLAEANPTAPVSLAVPAQHGWVPEAWPYGPEHFLRTDESPDTTMYSEPRLVHHLDEVSLARLTGVYRSAFEAVAPSFSVLDLCSSWASHFPEELLGQARVVVHGLNRAELEANKQATERHVQDLNRDSRLPWADGSFDFVTLALSVQYLTDPRAVFAEMNRVLRPGGMALVAFSHRCFIEKCVRVWAEETYDGEGHAHLVCRYFQHGPSGGWAQISSVDVSPRHGDPVWVVTAVKAAPQLLKHGHHPQVLGQVCGAEAASRGAGGAANKKSEVPRV